MLVPRRRAMSGRAAISRSVKVRPLSSGKAVLHTATSRNEASTVASSGADRGVGGIVTTASSGKAAAQGVDGLRRGLVRNAQADGGIFAVKTAEHLQQHGMQGRLAAGDGDHAAAQFALALQLGLARAQLLQTAAVTWA